MVVNVFVGKKIRIQQNSKNKMKTMPNFWNILMNFSQLFSFVHMMLMCVPIYLHNYYSTVYSLSNFHLIIKIHHIP